MMTGYDCLKEELRKRGYTQSQVDSNVVAGVLDIVSGEDSFYHDCKKQNDEMAKKRRDFEMSVRQYERRIEDLKRLVLNEENRLKAKIYEFEQMKVYIETFNESLKTCETPEGRDAMRRAQMFVNSVEVGSKYDNTAFIIALGSILSDGNVSAMEQLKKMNPKLFEREVRL